MAFPSFRTISRSISASAWRTWWAATQSTWSVTAPRRALSRSADVFEPIRPRRAQSVDLGARQRTCASVAGRRSRRKQINRTKRCIDARRDRRQDRKCLWFKSSPLAHGRRTCGSFEFFDCASAKLPAPFLRCKALMSASIVNCRPRTAGSRYSTKTECADVLIAVRKRKAGDAGSVRNSMCFSMLAAPRHCSHPAATKKGGGS